ncbi:hypothetical protein PR002_g3882 [Phytophthora rubi]|uniref:Uncharacterized protein n=1 Tax=Phytophthora rubi TaxID=129364 RepID=A0A6A3NDS9_9STRA|nr:hypothetical protein PR002_g3882 [Phytophthora rubi]
MRVPAHAPAARESGLLLNVELVQLFHGLVKAKYSMRFFLPGVFKLRLLAGWTDAAARAEQGRVEAGGWRRHLEVIGRLLLEDTPKLPLETKCAVSPAPQRRQPAQGARGTSSRPGERTSARS